MLTKEVMATTVMTCYGIPEVTSFLDEVCVRMLFMSGDAQLLRKLATNLAIGVDPHFGALTAAPEIYRELCVQAPTTELVDFLVDNRQYLILTLLVLIYPTIRSNLSQSNP
jgi:hypothetical protein